jgi:hypothetical protein
MRKQSAEITICDICGADSEDFQSFYFTQIGMYDICPRHQIIVKKAYNNDYEKYPCGSSVLVEDVPIWDYVYLKKHRESST